MGTTLIKRIICGCILLTGISPSLLPVITSIHYAQRGQQHVLLYGDTHNNVLGKEHLHSQLSYLFKDMEHSHTQFHVLYEEPIANPNHPLSQVPTYTPWPHQAKNIEVRQKTIAAAFTLYCSGFPKMLSIPNISLKDAAEELIENYNIAKLQCDALPVRLAQEELQIAHDNMESLHDEVDNQHFEWERPICAFGSTLSPEQVHSMYNRLLRASSPLFNINLIYQIYSSETASMLCLAGRLHTDKVNSMLSHMSYSSRTTTQVNDPVHEAVSFSIVPPSFHTTQHTS